jgi:hypothetical protein
VLPLHRTSYCFKILCDMILETVCNGILEFWKFVFARKGGFYNIAAVCCVERDISSVPQWVAKFAFICLHSVLNVSSILSDLEA